MKTITRADVAETIYEEIGLSRKDSNDILDMILDEIVQELSAGNDVKLSSFGTFALRNKKARAGRNPKTGVEAEISPRRVISFKPSLVIHHIHSQYFSNYLCDSSSYTICFQISIGFKNTRIFPSCSSC